jgi:hypothetical protein
VLRPNGPSPHALSQGRGVSAKPAEPNLAPVARDCDHPSTREESRSAEHSVRRDANWRDVSSLMGT